MFKISSQVEGTYINRFLTGIWMWKYSIKAIEDAIEFSGRILINMFRFINAQLANIHFIYSTSQGNRAVAQRMYMERFHGRNLMNF